MDIKKLCFIGFLFTSILVTSSFVSSSVLSDYNSVYDILSDVSPIDIVPPVGAVRYRWNNGVLQANYGLGSTWTDVTSPVELLYMLNQLGVASVDDIPTSADILDSITSYFGSPYWPTSITIRRPNTSGGTSYSFNSFSDTLGGFYTDLFTVLVDTPGTPILSASGSASTQNNSNSILTVLRTSFLGLGSLLGGGYSQGFSGLSSLGVRGGATYKTIPESLAFGFNGLAYRILGTSSISGSLYSFGQSSPQNFVYDNLGDILNSYLSSINQSLVVFPDLLYLHSDGTISSKGQYFGIPELLSNGLIALSHNQIGDPSDGYYYTWYDYSNLDTRVYQYDNILEALVGINGSIQSDLAHYMYSHGTDLDIQERENMQQQAEQFVDDFTSPDGNGTPTVSNVSDAAGVSGGLKDSFESDSTVSDIFTQLSDDGNFGFFSSRTQSELNPMYNSRSSYDDSFVDFLSPHLFEIDSKVGSSW